MVVVTAADTAGPDEWAITDEPDRFRKLGTSTSHMLPSPHLVDATITIGASEDCWLQLVDPLKKVSKTHASLVRHGGRWKINDLKSKNGIKLDGARRLSIHLTPGAEIEIGSIVLIVESPLLIQLRELLARLIGWSDARRADVDEALRSLRVAATRRESLLLCGDAGLVSIARILHNRTLGEDRPFVVCDPERRRPEPDARAAINYRDGLVALQEAIGGTICMWRERPLPDFDKVVSRLKKRTARVQIIVCSLVVPAPGLPPMGPTIVLPPLSERADEVPRIIEEFGRDYSATLGGALLPASLDWVLQHESSSLARIATATRRLVALNRADGNISEAASLLGMSKSSLGEWFATRPKVYK